MTSLRNHKPFIAFLLCALLALLVYLPGLSGDYMFDDMSNLLDNPALNIDSLDTEQIARAALSMKSGELRRPISMASFALNRYYFGISPFSHKLVNLIIHLLTGAGLFLLTRQIVAACRLGRTAELSQAMIHWLPVVVAGIWLVHPLNLTSVLYIVQRMTSLSSLFMVIGLCLYMAGRLNRLNGRHGLAYMLSGFFLFGALAVFSKETGILLPLYILVLELTLFRFSAGNGRLDRQVTVFISLCVLLPLLAGTLYLAGNLDRFANFSGREFSMTERLLTEARALVFYLKMALLPSVQALGLYHDDFVISKGLYEPSSTLYSLLALGGLLLTAILLIRKRPLVSLGILWFFAGHALESTLLPLELVHEHRNYLPVFGIILALAGLVTSLPVKRLSPLIHVGAPLLLLAMFASTTWLRSTQWSDNINHAVYEARHHPDSARAVFVAGRIHARLVLQGHAEYEDEAQTYLARAHQLDSTGIMPAITLVKFGFLTDKPVDPSLYEEIITRLSNHPVSASDTASLEMLAECLGETCHIPVETAERIFLAALKKGDSRILPIYGYYTINKLGNFDKGLALFERAVERTPDKPLLWKNLINLLMVMGRFDEAEQRLEEFIALSPYGSSAVDYSALQADIKAGREQAGQSLNAAAGTRTP
ncbi:MAG: tetratricopeptide repeat protein [Gammaproteobacteria bacterium]|nr:tetratricopeptide repeat protein [Gammaproteobacteria bacterium]